MVQGCSGFRVSGFGFRVSVFGFRVSGFGSRVSAFRFRVSGFGFRISGFAFQVSGFAFRGWGVHLVGGERNVPAEAREEAVVDSLVKVLGIRVEGLGFRC